MKNRPSSLERTTVERESALIGKRFPHQARRVRDTSQYDPRLDQHLVPGKEPATKPMGEVYSSARIAAKIHWHMGSACSHAAAIWSLVRTLNSGPWAKSMQARTATRSSSRLHRSLGQSDESRPVRTFLTHLRGPVGLSSRRRCRATFFLEVMDSQRIT
jgi:hypothetical protein